MIQPLPKPWIVRSQQKAVIFFPSAYVVTIYKKTHRFWFTKTLAYGCDFNENVAFNKAIDRLSDQDLAELRKATEAEHRSKYGAR